jgi:hypothetical protein
VKHSLDRLGEAPPREHVANLQEAWDADALVVRCELVPGDRESGVVPADADPGADPERKDHRFSGNAPLDSDHVFLVGCGKVVVVRDEQPFRARRADHQVGAASRRGHGGELLDGGGKDG